MALRPPTRTKDQITLISWLDSSIDQTVEGFGDIVGRYMAMDVPDPSILPRVEGSEDPTEFVVRPLSEREIGICDDLSRQVTTDADGEVVVDVSTSEQNWQYVRFGLVEVKKWGGNWSAERERFYSFNPWKLKDLESHLDQYTVQMLGTIIRRWSVLQKKTSDRSISSRESGNGTEPIRAASVPTIVKSAEEMKGIEKCTDATGGAQSLAK